MGSNPLDNKIQRSLLKAQETLKKASIEEDFQTVGLLCREALISLAQHLYDPSIHSSPDGVTPSKTDAKRMFDAYIAHELAGNKNETIRRNVRSSLDLAIELQHKRTANENDAARCIIATKSIIDHLTIISGEKNNLSHLQGIDIEFSYSKIDITAAMHIYQLEISINNHTNLTLENYRLDFSFPDLDNIPPRGITFDPKPLKPENFITIEPSSKDIKINNDLKVYRISIPAIEKIFLGDQIQLGKTLGLKYIFTNRIYWDLENYPNITWTFFADGIQPIIGEKSLEELNNF